MDRTSIAKFDNNANGVTLDLQTRVGEEPGVGAAHMHNEAASEEVRFVVGIVE